MKKITAILALSIFCFTTLLRAEDPVSRTRIETLFASLKPGEIDPAIDAFAKDTLMRPEFVDQLKSQAKAILTPERKILGFEFIQEQAVGGSIKRITYLLKLSDQPLLWTFSFYKPAAKWIPLRVSFGEEY